MFKKLAAVLISLAILITPLYVVSASAESDIISGGITYSAQTGSILTYTVNLQSTENIKNGGFSVIYPAELTDIQSVNSPYADYEIKDGKIEFNIDTPGDFSEEKALISIDFKITNPGKIEYKLNINSLSNDNGLISEDSYTAKEKIYFKNPSYISSEATPDEAEKLNIPWEIGRLAAADGSEVEETSKRYYRGGFINTDTFNTVDITVIDDTYRYNVFFYNNNKKFISALENKNPPDLNVNDTVSLPQNTAYIRVVVCRSGNLGGVEDNILEKNNKVYFRLLNIENSTETTEYIPRQQGIFKEGRLTISSGTDVPDDRNIYYATDFISTKDLKAVDVEVHDNTYRYNIFWYNSAKSYLGCLQNSNPPTLNKSKTYNISQDASYCRLEVCRKSNVGGVEDGALLGKDKIAFNLIPINTESIEPSESTETKPTTQPSAEIVTQATEPESVTPSQKPDIVKKANPIKIKIYKKVIKAKTLKKKAVKIKAFKITKAKGKVTYKRLKGSSKRLSLISKSGKIKIKKSTKKGKYKYKIKITAKGNNFYKSKSIIKTIKIKVI
jgi:hypothetical protein